MTNNNCTIDRPNGDSHESIDYNHKTKTIYFVRHGVALHNVPDYSTGDYHNKYDPRLTDPPLISDGEEQIRNVGRKLRGVELDLVVTSPLTRCLQTTQLIMYEWNSLNSVSSPHVVCLENVREAFGKHYPDKRSPKSSLQVSVLFAIISEYPYYVLWIILRTFTDTFWFKNIPIEYMAKCQL